MTFEREHFDHLLRQRAADAGQRAPIEVGGMRRIMETGLVLVALAMTVIVGVFVTVTVGMIMVVIVRLAVLMIVAS
jgi:hypothetical protein